MRMQIEVNRCLYMDERTLAEDRRLPSPRADLTRFIGALAAALGCGLPGAAPKRPNRPKKKGRSVAEAAQV